MSDTYNYELQERFQDSLCLAKDDSSYFLYLKSCNSPNTASDVLPLAYIETKPTKTGEELYVSASWAISGFGNIIYAFTMMDLNKEGKFLCCDRDANLSDAAYHVWASINNNENYLSKNLKVADLCEEYLETTAEDLDISLDELLDKIEQNELLEALDGRNKCFTTKPDIGFTYAVKNHENANLSNTITKELTDDCIAMFDALMFEGMEGVQAEKLKKQKRNNFAELEQFIKTKVSIENKKKNSFRR